MLRLALHLFHLEGGAPGSAKIKDGWRLSKKTEFCHCWKDKTSTNHFRQRLSIWGYRKLDKEETEEREAARPPCERRHHMAIQPFQIPMVGRNVLAIDQGHKKDSLQDIRQNNPKLPTARNGDHWHRETLEQPPFDILWKRQRMGTSLDPECFNVGAECR